MSRVDVGGKFSEHHLDVLPDGRPELNVWNGLYAAVALRRPVGIAADQIDGDADKEAVWGKREGQE